MATLITCSKKIMDLMTIMQSLFSTDTATGGYGFNVHVETVAEDWNPVVCKSKLEWEILLRKSIHIGGNGRPCLNIVLMTHSRDCAVAPPCASGIANDVFQMLGMSFVNTADGEVALALFNCDCDNDQPK